MYRSQAVGGCGCLAPFSHALATATASGVCAGLSLPSAPRSLARNVEAPTLWLRTIEGDIRAGKVIFIIDI
jgi:hypothetical protein